ncbi:MAG: GTP-binding protein [Candidatus Pacebacteria bacterium CG_4_10_14_0_8_um_filter_42_14]|nr:MAG: GTP-binding protein [Candidatus Pacebacteria bacterium CG_4_10_14_0_8_um_filter_42_14]
MIPRTIASKIQDAVVTFPAIVVTGPRQSGKTTLLKHLFPKATYVNLELPDLRSRAVEDPRLFLDSLVLPVILDEIQYVPELLPYIKDRIDSARTAGQWLLTGSQLFPLMKGVSESLAGRIAVFSLLPFSIDETPKSKVSFPSTMLRGSYPEIVLNKKVDRDLWLGSYINTYLERDVRNLETIGDLRQFEIFMRLLATKTGQILDQSELAKAVGVSVPTIERWISILEASYQIVLIHPYFKNIGKRLIKRPKIYFTDLGIVSYLLGITDIKQLVNGSSWGALFETAIVVDLWKQYLHRGRKSPLYFLRTYDGLEVDLVIDMSDRIKLVEIKATASIKPSHAVSLEYTLKTISIPSEAYVVSLSKFDSQLTTLVTHFSVEAFSKGSLVS